MKDIKCNIYHMNIKINTYIVRNIFNVLILNSNKCFIAVPV